MRRARSIVVDLHADLLWRSAETGKDALANCPGEVLDLPAMWAGGPTLQMFTLYTPAEHKGPAATAYAERLLGIFHDLRERSLGRLGFVRDARDLDALDPDGLAGVLSMEGASPLRGELAQLDRFHALGVRSLGLTHNPRNEAGDGCMVPAAERRGLTPFGRAVVRRCVELGVLLDVAHLAPEGVDDLLDEVERLPSAPPVVTTHTGCAALTAHPRNLSDSVLRRLADLGGLAGITCYPPHVARAGHASGLNDVVAHVEHVAEVCGIEHVALGADLDGFDPPGLPGGADTPALYAQLEDALGARGFSAGHIALVLGGNALRVLRRVL